MNRRFPLSRTLRVMIVVGTCLFAVPTMSLARQVPAVARAGSKLPSEPFAAVASMAKAGEYLDRVALGWTNEKKCGSCHTNYPYLGARPALGETSERYAQVRSYFENRVVHWDDAAPESKPKWPAEVVLTAEGLARGDHATTGTLHPITRQALDRMWTVQKADGGFEWVKCDWYPLEYDDYYGAVIAALAVGHAPGGYAKTAKAKAGLERLRGYFAKNSPPVLHHRTMLLWASCRVDGLMTDKERQETIASLRKLERPGGGWAVASLGDWDRRDGSPNDPNGPADAYATGLIAFALREAGVPAEDPALRRSVAWLLANQRSSGGWFTRSLNDDDHHYIAHAGSAYAVLALRACGYQDGEPRMAAKTIQAGKLAAASSVPK